MNLSIHNLQRHRTFRSLAVLVIAAQIFVSIPAKATASKEEFFSNDAIKRLFIAIILVNRAMRSAAENPMDKWRRQNVQHAISALPLAIVGVAKEFKANQFHGADFPILQKMMAGYVDVNAAENYKKFLKTPSKGSIPALHAGIPKSLYREADAKSTGSTYQSVHVKEDGTTGGTLGPEAKGQDTGSSPQKLDELVSLAAQGGNAPKVEAAKSTGSTYENVEVDAQTGLTAPADTPSAPAPDSRADFAPSLVNDVKSDLEVIRIEKKPEVEKTSEDEFFKEKPAEPKKPLKRKDRRTSLGKMLPFALAWRVLNISAFAKGCGGSESEEGGGGKAGEILMGLAMIMAAVAPMVAAAIQADADKQIAKTQAKSAKELAQISQQTTLQLSDNNKHLAQEQAAAVERMAQQNNAAATERMNMQLAQIEKGAMRDDTVKQREFARQQQYDNERIRLAEKQAALNESYQQRELSVQLTQAGLATGTQSVNTNMGNRLVSTRVVPPVGRTTTVYNSAKTQGGFTGIGVANTQQTRGIASSKLLVSAGVGSMELNSGTSGLTAASKVTRARGIKKLGPSLALGSTPTSRAVSRGISALRSGMYRGFASKLIAGSTRAAMLKSDISQFQAAVENKESFAHSVIRNAQNRRSTISLGNSHSRGTLSP